jgi:hypothetical protein
MVKKTVLKPTHLYRGRQVEYCGSTYTARGQKYCTILMVNKHGKHQRQTVQERLLTALLPSGDTASQPTLSAICGDPYYQV